MVGMVPCRKKCGCEWAGQDAPPRPQVSLGHLAKTRLVKRRTELGKQESSTTLATWQAGTWTTRDAGN